MTVTAPPPQSPSTIAVTDGVAGMRRHSVPILGTSTPKLPLGSNAFDPGPWLVNVKPAWVGGFGGGYSFLMYIGFYTKENFALLKSAAWDPAWDKLNPRNIPLDVHEAMQLARARATAFLEPMPFGDWPAGGTNNQVIVFEYDWYVPGGTGSTLLPDNTQLGSTPWLAAATWNGGGAMSWSDVSGEVGPGYPYGVRYGGFNPVFGSVLGPDNKYYPSDAAGWDTYTPNYNPTLLPAADPLAEFDCPIVVVIFKSFATNITYGLYPPVFEPGTPGFLTGGSVKLYNKVRTFGWNLKVFGGAAYYRIQGPYKRLVLDQHQHFWAMDAANWGSNVSVGWADISQPPDAPTTFGGAVSVKSGLF